MSSESQTKNFHLKAKLQNFLDQLSLKWMFCPFEIGQN